MPVKARDLSGELGFEKAKESPKVVKLIRDSKTKQIICTTSSKIPTTVKKVHPHMPGIQKLVRRDKTPAVFAKQHASNKPVKRSAKFLLPFD